MFKNNPFAGVLPFRNGGSLSPIGGTTSLASALAGVERAEQALAAARALARSAAKREGHSVRGLFEDSQFILRATGEKWVDQARSEGEEAHRILVDHLLMAQGKDPDAVRARIAESIKRDSAAAAARHERWTTIMKQAGWHDAIAAGDHERAGRIMFKMHDTLTEADAHVLPRAAIERRERDRVAATGKATGAAIVAAGKRARMSADAAGEVPDPEKGSFAAKVILAGQRRRGEVE